MLTIALANLHCLKNTTQLFSQGSGVTPLMNLREKLTRKAAEDIPEAEDEAGTLGCLLPLPTLASLLIFSRCPRC
jgi:hypothetical protein